MDVVVTFDPCALDSHDWRPIARGIGRLVGAEECAKCWKTRVPDCPAGVDQRPNPYWKSNVEVG